MIALLAAGQLAQSSTTTILITASRIERPFYERASAASIIEKEELELHPSETTDQLLRALPSVATFRRSSSLSADPSSQGLNLRGVAPSGVSRTLILLDGVPVNDPFGGWVYWRALPRLGMQRIEVVPGGASSLYGSAALGGVVQIISRELRERSFELDASYGSFGTVLAAARLSERSVALEGELLRSEGHPVVRESQRGAIDQDAPSVHGSLNGRFQVELFDELELRGRAGWFKEAQNGGTELTTADVETLSLSLASTWGGFEAYLYGGIGSFSQQRARIAPERASEAPAAEQKVPSREIGGGLSYRRSFGAHLLLAGGDARILEGESRETTFTPPGRRTAGGEQLFAGAYLQNIFRVYDDLELNASARFDVWRNAGGFRRAGVNTRSFPARAELELSPRTGVLWRVLETWHLRAAGFRSFRAPTLNELYRPFQVGTVRTAANEALDAEHLLGGELGTDLYLGAALTVEATAFYNLLEKPIINATLARPLPDGSTRRRENLGRARIAGVESALELSLARGLSLRASYTFVQAVVTENDADPELIGKRLPQAPEHRATIAVVLKELGTLQLRWLGPQLEDDHNQLELPGFVVVDLFASRPIGAGIEIFGSIENLLDRRYLVGRSGVDTVGAPRFLRAGLRARL